MCFIGGLFRCCLDGGGVQFLQFGFVGVSVFVSLWFVFYDLIKEGQLLNVVVYVQGVVLILKDFILYIVFWLIFSM